MEITLEILAILFVVATAAGFIDAMAGGGGLLTLPALLAAGVPPTQALATNKTPELIWQLLCELVFRA